jgi:hypothetical protein
VFNDKSNREKSNFTYLQTSKNAFLNLELWEVNLLYVIACCGKKDKLFYCIPNFANIKFLIGYLFNDDKLQ